MSARTSKSTLVYDALRSALQTGRLAPGERIDPAALAGQLKTSSIPVRFALYRLVGEGAISDHAREGFHVPFATELMLRELYDWMDWLTLKACDVGFPAAPKHAEVRAVPQAERDVATRTHDLFEAIALATERPFLHRAIRHANDRLAPVRRIEPELIHDAPAELAALMRHWQRRELKPLKTAMNDYHERRRRLVPQIVAIIDKAAPYGSD